MATVYSLVCFGGLSGKTVTFTDSGDVVNLTNHGLRQGVTGVVFSTTGTLPVGITAGATYYPRDGADTGKFTLYPTKADALAGTNQVTFTGTGSGTHTVKSANMLSADLSRYGSTRVYDGLTSWYSDRSSLTTLFTDEVCEILDAFTEYGYHIIFTMKSSSTLITARVNGVMSDGHHGGTIGKGFIFRGADSGGSAIDLYWLCTIIEGFSVRNSSGNIGVSIGQLCKAINIIVDQSGNHGFAFDLSLSYAINCMAVGGAGNGFYIRQYVNPYIFNCIAAKNSYLGFAVASSPVNGFYYNNISLGNGTNWGTAPSAPYDAKNNAGESGNSPWYTGTNASVVISTADFLNYSLNDFHAASVDSVQVDAGVTTPGEYAFDISDDVRPSYNLGIDEYYDIGPFEYDHGNGLAPVTATLTISANTSLSGAEIRIYDADNTPAGTLGTELSGTESNPSTTYTYSATSLLNNTIYIQVMQSGYEEFLTSHTVTNINETLTLTLKDDVNA